MESKIFKIVSKSEWAIAEQSGVFTGSAVDNADGFIHLSTESQTPETLAKHFAGQANLLLVTVDAAALGETLKWEPSRGGELFPHIYGDLPLTAVVHVEPIPIASDS